MAHGLKEHHGKRLLFSDSPNGVMYLDPAYVFIRASDARVFIGNPQGMRHLSQHEYDMVQHLPLVQQVGVAKVGA